MALNKLTGEPIWTALPAKTPGYSSPIIIEAGGARQLIVWTPESLNSLDPETGKIYWTQEIACQLGLSVATPRRVGWHRSMDPMAAAGVPPTAPTGRVARVGRL